MKIYLAGPMSGIAQFNFPEFIRVAGLLRTSGWEVVSPAELDEQTNADDYKKCLASKAGSFGDTSQTWGDYLARDVKLIADAGIKGIVFLPGWGRSKGARLEAFVGLSIPGTKFYEYLNDQVLEMDPHDVLETIALYLHDTLPRT